MITEETGILLCPVCRSPLISGGREMHCKNGHCFDISKEGYVNLLTGQKPGNIQGDSRDMANSRHLFLQSGAYFSLAKAVGDVLEQCSERRTVLDICCGEGYYTEMASERFPESRFFGFDLSKNMVRLAAKRRCNAEFFVANLANIPIKDGAADFAFHLFAPFNEREFARILSDKGKLVTAVPGREHLLGLKEVLYDKPYENDEKPPETAALRVTDKIRAEAELTLDSQEKISALLRMTPYYYHTPTKGLDRLNSLSSLTTKLDFVLYVMEK